MTYPSLGGILVATMLLGAVGSARADTRKERARQHFVAAKSHYAAQRYRRAIAEFRRAARILPSPLLDFNIARCFEALGDVSQALRYYGRYLRGRPKAANRKQVEARIAALRRQQKAGGDPYADLESVPTQGDHGSVVVAPAASAQPLGPAVVSAPAAEARPLAPSAQPSSQPSSAAASARQEATSQPASARAATRPPLSTTPPDGRDNPWSGQGRREESLLRQWWFWTAVGVGAVIATFIIVTTATSSAENAVQPARGGLSIAF